MLEQMPLNEEWSKALSAVLASEEMEQLDRYLDERSSAGATIYPLSQNVFAALNAVSPQNVKLVLIGQDPYHRKGQAHGLSFSVQRGNKTPPSLQNMFKEMKTDIGKEPAEHGDLTRWAEQGVLLLNAVLTVEEGKPLAHKGKGWEKFTDAVIDYINEASPPCVFLLWGNYAKNKGKRIDKSRHAIITGIHPSPLSANRGFFGTKPFSKVNSKLIELGREPIVW